MKNKIKYFLDNLGITPYRFWHDTGISRVTAYKLYKEPGYIPGADVLVKICDTYQIQPGEILVWFSDEEEEKERKNDRTQQEEIDQQHSTRESINSTSQERQTGSFFHVISEVQKSA